MHPILDTLRGYLMISRLSLSLRNGFCAAICFAILSSTALAQSPDGPQTSAPPQADPKLQQKAPVPQEKKPEEAGVTIAVEVPVVTIDVIATTVNGDVIPGLKKGKFPDSGRRPTTKHHQFCAFRSSHHHGVGARIQ